MSEEMKPTKKHRIGWFDDCEGIRDCATVVGALTILTGKCVRHLSLSALSKGMSVFSSDLSARVDRYRDETFNE